MRFAGQTISRTAKVAEGLTAFQRAFQRASHMPPAWGEQILCLEKSKKKVQITDKFSDGAFLGINECSEQFIVGTLAGCVVCRTVKRRPREDAEDLVFFNSIQMTNHANPQSQESNRCESCAFGSLQAMTRVH